MIDPDDQATLSRFEVRDTIVDVNGAPFTIRHPSDAESLIDEEAFNQDERLPYWADVWPASIALARLISRMEARGRTLLELGCGVGLVSAAALRAGFDVTATDYYEEALAFTRVNGRSNTSHAPRTRLVDWRDPPADLGLFDVVVAADVLYERAYGPLVAGIIARTLGPSGTAWVADPGRIGASAFIDVLPAHGLRRRGASMVTLATGARAPVITIHELVR